MITFVVSIDVDGGYLANHENHTTWSVAFVAEDLRSTQQIVLSAGGIASFDRDSPLFLGENLCGRARCSGSGQNPHSTICAPIFHHTHNAPVCIV